MVATARWEARGETEPNPHKELTNMNKTSKRALALGASAAVLATAGVAYAYWSTTGSGSGTATTAAGEAANSPTITVLNLTAPSNLAPGMLAGPVAATLHNSSTTAASYVNTVTVAIGQPTKGENPTTHVPIPAADCSASDYELQAGHDYQIFSQSFPPEGNNPTAVTSITMDVHQELAVQDNAAGHNADDVALPDAQLGFYDRAVSQDGCKGVTVPLIVTTN